MPDYEPVFDQLTIDLAKTPEQKEYAKGYIAGKTKARKEVALITVAMAVLSVIVIINI